MTKPDGLFLRTRFRRPNHLQDRNRYYLSNRPGVSGSHGRGDYPALCREDPGGFCAGFQSDEIDVWLGLAWCG